LALLEEFASKHLFPQGQGFELITQPSELGWPDEDIPDETALKIVAQDKALAVAWTQTKGWVLEWERQARLYLFKVPVRFWDGTNVPRSALGMPLVYEHVESVLPQLMSAIFGDDPPFMTRPRPSTSMDTARANSALLQWELKQAKVKQEVRLGLKYMAIHGTGIWKWGWTSYNRERTIYTRKAPYKFLPLPGGGGVRLSQKGTNDIVPQKINDEINIPTFEHRNLRHILVDPSLRTSDIRQGKYVIDLQYPTILDLDKLRDFEGYNIPPRSELIQLLFQAEEVPPQNPLEVRSLLFQEFQSMPRQQKSTMDKTQQPLELTEYWSKDRVFTVLQGKLVIRNEKNPFGVIPFLSSTMADVLDAFYGLGIANTIGNEQRMQQGVMNGYLDDFSLNLNGMFTRIRGSNVQTQQLRMRPGGIIDQDQKDGIGVLARQPLMTGDVQSVLSASDSRSARRTAASETSVQGAMPSGNSSVTRTATGVNSLSSGTGTRLQAIVEQFSTQVFEPMLENFHKMNALYLRPDQINRILTKELGIAYQGDTLNLINGQYDFDMLAGSRLQAKNAMKQSLPLLYQFLLTEPVLDSLKANGKKVNVAELVKMTFDVSGWPNMNDIIVDMTPEDQQQAQANSPAAIQQAQLGHTAQLESIKTQGKAQLLTQDNEDRTGREVIRELLRNGDKSALGLS